MGVRVGRRVGGLGRAAGGLWSWGVRPVRVHRCSMGLDNSSWSKPLSVPAPVTTPHPHERDGV